MSDFEHLDYYELLGISRTASLDEVKRAYRREISKYHPDRFVNGSPEEQTYASQRSQRLTEAYGVLSDFAARSTYNRGHPVVGPAIRQPRSPAAESRHSAGSSPPRDHQAELYKQAQQHMAKGRWIQAVGTLRQLQKINPFYRDSADLLADAETRLGSQQEKVGGHRARPLLVAGGLAGGVAIVALAVWAIGMRGATASRPPDATSAPAALVATAPATRPPEPTFAPEPTTEAPTSRVEPSPIPPTQAPTTAAELPTATPFEFPTVTPTAGPTAVPALAGEAGPLLLADRFAQGGWATLRGQGWQVGYQTERYRIAANRGLGTIWSYRSTSVRDFGMGVDIQATSGEAGVLLRFQDENNYLSVSLNPSQTSFRVEQHEGGATNVIAGGQSEAIRAGADAINRLVVRLDGSHLQILANGQPIAEADAPGIPDSARYGLLVLTTDSAAEAFFDNLEIRGLD